MDLSKIFQSSFFYKDASASVQNFLDLINIQFNSFMTEAVIIQKSVHWFVEQINDWFLNGLRHERVKWLLIIGKLNAIYIFTVNIDISWSNRRDLEFYFNLVVGTPLKNI